MEDEATDELCIADSCGEGDAAAEPPAPLSGSRVVVLPDEEATGVLPSGGAAGVVLPGEDAAAAEASWREAQSLARECGWSEVVSSDWARSREVGCV